MPKHTVNYFLQNSTMDTCTFSVKYFTRQSHDDGDIVFLNQFAVWNAKTWSFPEIINGEIIMETFFLIKVSTNISYLCHISKTINRKKWYIKHVAKNNQTKCRSDLSFQSPAEAYTFLLQHEHPRLTAMQGAGICNALILQTVPKKSGLVVPNLKLKILFPLKSFYNSRL